MLRRREAGRAAALLLVLAAAPSALRAQPAPDPAAAETFIRQAGADLGALVRASTGLDDRRRRLTPFLEKVVDMDGLSRFCLGRYWAVATPAQRERYGRLFRGFLANGVAGRLGDYSEGAANVTAGKPEPQDDGSINVPTTVTRPGNRPNRVVWAVRPDGASFRIIDVVAEGISLRLTQRSDFSAFLSRNGADIGALLQAMASRAGAEGSATR